MNSWGRKRRESDFWDEQASAKLGPEALKASLRARPPEIQEPAYGFYLQSLGELKGKRILECGCGDGKLSVYLASCGAEVYSFDISVANVALCQSRASACRVADHLFVTVADLESLPYSDIMFDVVCGTFVLHHVDTTMAGQELVRVLKPGGRAVFLENSAANPILMLGRQRLVGRLGIPRMGSPDEHPLRTTDIQQLEAWFGRIERHFPQLVFFRLAFYRLVLAALPVERFPKGPVRCMGNWFWKMGPWLDNVLYRWLPFARRYSWWQVLVLTDPKGPNG